MLFSVCLKLFRFIRLLIIFYWSKDWSLTQIEIVWEHNADDIAWTWEERFKRGSRLPNEELYNLYENIRNDEIKEGEMGGAWLTHGGNEKCVHNFCWTISLRCTHENSRNIYLEETGMKGVHWIHQSLRIALENSVINVLVPQKTQNILTSWETLSFSRNMPSLLHRDCYVQEHKMCNKPLDEILNTWYIAKLWVRGEKERETCYLERFNP